MPGQVARGGRAPGPASWALFAGGGGGRLHGIARGAQFLLAKTEDIRSETRVEEDNYVAALEWADSIGVDIASSSLAYLVFDNGFSYTPSQLNGDVAVTTVAADMAAQRGILVVTAAGNEGPGFRSIWTPADGDSVLAIGAEDSLGTIAFFSSRGPTADGRLKPDFTGPGVAVCVVTDTGQVRRLNGTSFSTPLIAAGAALVKQLHPTLAPMRIRDAFRSVGNHRARPDSTYGWGRPDITAAAAFPNGVTPTAPLPRAGPLTTITPTFSRDVGTVDPAVGPITYHLRIARDSVLATSLADTSLTIENYLLRKPVKPGAPLFWRVDAHAPIGESASTRDGGPVLLPACATLTSLSSPAGSVTDSAQPPFTWPPPPGATPPGPFTVDLSLRRVSAGTFDYAAAGLTDTVFRIPALLERNTAYRWQLVVHAGSDTSLVRGQGSFLIVDGGMPTSTLLYQNFPNPFPTAGRDSTCLRFHVGTTSGLTLEILDLRGNPVRRFIPGPDFPAILPAGRYGRGSTGGTGICHPHLMWDGRADDGHLLPPGVYLAKLKAPGLLEFKRIVFRGK